jgi:hypothetical protein
MKRIVAIQQLRTKKILGSNQDGSREFISLLAAICADGTALPPALIYKGNSNDLQDTWLEDFDGSSEDAHFAVSKKGWTNEELGMSWLSKIFEPRTREKAGNHQRLLIVDGHSSHVNLRFIEFCDRNHILLAILPPHSTHRLQPLDVGIFSPLSTAYSKEIDRLIQSSHGFSRVTKRNFWTLFRTAWNSALTFENIRSAFATPGIYPIDQSKVLRKIKKETPSPIMSDSERKQITPGSVRGLRRAVKAIAKEKEDINLGIDLIIRASEKLAIRNEILEHEVKGLRTALVNEKKRRKRGKPAGLLDQGRPGAAQFFSPAKVTAVRNRMHELEEQKQREKAEAEERRQNRAAEKERKAQEALERREERRKAQEEKRQQKEREKEERLVQQRVNKQIRQEKKLRKDQKKAEKKPQKRKREDAIVESSKRQKSVVGRNGRQITLPVRFQD